MRHVAYLHCPQCLEDRIYVLYDEPWDENDSQCQVCGHSFGYCVSVKTELGPDGMPVASASPRPVLDPDVLAAGMRRLQQETIARLSERHGLSVVLATKQLHDGLEETDRAARARKLNARLPGLAR